MLKLEQQSKENETKGKNSTLKMKSTFRIAPVFQYFGSAMTRQKTMSVSSHHFRYYEEENFRYVKAAVDRYEKKTVRNGFPRSGVTWKPMLFICSNPVEAGIFSMEIADRIKKDYPKIRKREEWR